MLYTPVEIMALIFIIAVIIKITVIIINPEILFKISKKISAKPFLISLISLILAGIVLFYLLKELTIVQIFASMLFFSLLMSIGILSYSKEVKGFIEKSFKNKKILKKSWLSLIIWIILIIWVFKELFIK